MYSFKETNEYVKYPPVHPRLIFFTELDGSSLERVLSDNTLLSLFTTHNYGIAITMSYLNDALANVVCRLNQYGIYTVAWMLLPPEQGYWFNVQNYPQALEHYRLFRAWSQQHQLHFHAVGLDMRPPSEVLHIQRWGIRSIARRFWLAQENVLFSAARSAYVDLIARIHHDGYEVHTYQIPILADDRRAGTTLIQRALDIVDLPSDIEVLICYSSIPVEFLRNDLKGLLITSYGSSADSIGVGNTGSSTIPDGLGWGGPPLSWESFRCDLLLAAQYTDTMYISSFEGCLERGFLPLISNLNWNSETSYRIRYRILIEIARLSLLIILLFARFGNILLAWLGWGLAILLFIQRIRCKKKKLEETYETLASKN